jgi:hypothetical protein
MSTVQPHMQRQPKEESAFGQRTGLLDLQGTCHGHACWGSVQITKKLCATQPRLPKDLSISNVVTVRSFGHVPSMTEMRGLHSRTSVAVVADLKVVKNLVQRLRHRMSGTSTYSHTYGYHDDSWNPVSSRDAEVETLEQGSGTLQHDDVSWW